MTTEMTRGSEVYVRHEDRDRTTEVVAFGVRDAKGRELGAVIARYVTVCRLDTDPKPLGYLETKARPVGSTRYAVVYQQTRAGKRFGSTQPGRYFETPEDREAAIAAYLKAARARAAKGGAQ